MPSRSPAARPNPPGYRASRGLAQPRGVISVMDRTAFSPSLPPRPDPPRFARPRSLARGLAPMHVSAARETGNLVKYRNVYFYFEGRKISIFSLKHRIIFKGAA